MNKQRGAAAIVLKYEKKPDLRHAGQIRIRGGGHQAWCPCGRRFARRAFRSAAMDDLVAHYQKKGRWIKRMNHDSHRSRYARFFKMLGGAQL